MAWQETYYHYDGMGNTVALTDESGQATGDQYVYTAFGELIGASFISDNSFLYNGRVGYYHDRFDTDEYYVRRRTYEPRTARWMSSDPLFLIGKTDEGRYVYVLNSPLNNVDPSGEFIALWFECFRRRCCKRAKEENLDLGNIGGLVCCEGHIVVCTWMVNAKAKDKLAMGIIESCVFEHEKCHVPTQKCPGDDPFERTVSSINHDLDECMCYIVELLCLSRKIWICEAEGRRGRCLGEVQDRIDFTIDRIAVHCAQAMTTGPHPQDRQPQNTELNRLEPANHAIPKQISHARSVPTDAALI